MADQPITLVKEGYFVGDLKGALYRYGSGFKPLPNLDREKYGLYIPESPSLVVVARMKNGFILNGANRVNLYASFSSFSNQTDLEMLAEFERRTGIGLPSDHRNLRNISFVMSIAFQEIIKGGPKVLDQFASY